MGTDEPAGGVVENRVSRPGRTWRLTSAAAVLALLVAGTLFGQDSSFPVGPFRMFSTRDDPNGTVSTTELEGRTATGDDVRITGTETGLRRAEVEGQLDRFVRDPALLRTVADAYSDVYPGRELVRIEVVRRSYPLRDGRATGEERVTVLASWDRPDRPEPPE